MKLVMAFGTFDHFHAGHESYLRQAKRLGDTLIVVVARDSTVIQLKGKTPQHHERQRKKAVEAGNIADRVILGDPVDKYKVIKKYKPSVIALGYDQFAFTFKLNKFIIDQKIDSRVIRLKAYKPEVYKSSILRKNHD